MLKYLSLALLAMPAEAAELWCMPSQLCLTNAACKPTTDTESSIRLKVLDAPQSTLRTHAEDVTMTRRDFGDLVEWRGVNAAGAAEYLVWQPADRVYNYTVTQTDGGIYKAIGYCEIQ